MDPSVGETKQAGTNEEGPESIAFGQQCAVWVHGERSDADG